MAAIARTTKIEATFREPVAAMAPRAKSKESPGRKGVTTKPVSAKDDEEENQVAPQAVVLDDEIEVLIQVQDKINQPKNPLK